jgi:hypothetical protein
VDKLQKDLDRLGEWAVENAMKMIMKGKLGVVGKGRI